MDEPFDVQFVLRPPADDPAWERRLAWALKMLKRRFGFTVVKPPEPVSRKAPSED